MNTNTSWQIWCTLTCMDTLIHEYKQGPNITSWQVRSTLTWTLTSMMNTNKGLKNTSWQIRSTLTWTLTSMNTNKGLKNTSWQIRSSYMDSHIHKSKQRPKKHFTADIRSTLTWTLISIHDTKYSLKNPSCRSMADTIHSYMNSRIYAAINSHSLACQGR